MKSVANQPSWPEILRGALATHAREIHTALPGTVVSYDTPTQVATVQLTVQLEGVSVPPLAEVPVAWPGGAAGFLHVPLAAGDPVLVIFSEEDFSGWFTTGSISPPKVLARHGLHAIAIPGLRRAAAPFGATAGHVTLAATTMLHLGSDTATAFVALANLVESRLSAMQTVIDTHVHTSAAPASPTSPPTPPIVWPTAPVAASKVKAT